MRDRRRARLARPRRPRRSGRRDRGGSPRERSSVARHPQGSERDLVEILARARSLQRARPVDADVCARLRAPLGGVAFRRKGPAGPKARSMDGVVPVPGAIPGQAPLHADVLKDLMGKARVLSEFWQFLRQEKKYWLVPIVIVFILFGLLIVFSQSSAVAPFIYTLF